MRIAFVGKGGAGKTSVCALFGRFLAQQGCKTILVDGDINQHLGTALGIKREAIQELPDIGNHMLSIKEYLRGENELIPSAAVMQKTTPPGRGSRLLRFDESNPIWDRFIYRVPTTDLGSNGESNDLRFIRTGEFVEEDIGVSCYHAKTGAVELILNHLADRSEEYFLVDMTAGADAFASGLFTKFDLTVLLVEPSWQSVGVYRQYLGYCQEFGVALAAIGNKVSDENDSAFLRAELQSEILTYLPTSQAIRRSQRGENIPLCEYEPALIQGLRTLYSTAQTRTRDWHKLYQQTVEIHRKNARSWANALAGCDLEMQIDPVVDGGIYS